MCLVSALSGVWMWQLTHASFVPSRVAAYQMP